MKKLPLVVILTGCLFSFLYGITHSMTTEVNGVRYVTTNYTIIAVGMAISLLAGIIILWIIKKKDL